TWFVPTFRQWITQLYPKPEILIEPFAGGGIISLTALFENSVTKAIMVELDDDIAAVWKTVVDGNADWLAERILSFEISRESVIDEISKTPRNIKEKAFQTILKNRTYHGGILAAGSGLLKHGENGKGIHSRWYPITLAKRFINLMKIANKIDFRCEDGLDVIREFQSVRNAIFFIDPPYTAGGKKAGKRLYKYYELNHEKLFTMCEAIEGDFLMTYDDAEEVKVMARYHGFQMRLIPMTNTHHATMKELVVGKNLKWMDQFPAVHEPKTKYQIRKKQRQRQVKRSNDTRSHRSRTG
ncbi:MAG: DNA adenine methylase, partial [Gammaproteobacteria bacterium]|nr:DNA adenine methylase [Gammaproteobacteria bacterium]